MDAYRAPCAHAERDYEAFWARHARELLHWNKPFTKVLDESNAPFYKWFEDGELNASSASRSLFSRTYWKCGEGSLLAERRGQHVILARDMLATLRNRELAQAAQDIAAETRLEHRPLADGQRAAGYLPPQCHARQQALRAG